MFKHDGKQNTMGMMSYKTQNTMGTLYCLYYTLLKQGKNKDQKSSAKRHILTQYKKKKAISSVMLTFQNRLRKTLALVFVTEKNKLKLKYIVAYIKNFEETFMEARELAIMQEV